MEFLLFLPLLLLGGLFLGGGGDDPEPAAAAPVDPAAGEIETGTSASEEMSGTALNDLLLGGRGADLLEGLDGNDALNGEFGNDTISGDAGNDVLLGAEGRDFLAGGTGNDLVIGGQGNDSLSGESGNDVLFGSSGSDTINGGDGDDVLVGLEYTTIEPGLGEISANLDTVLASRFPEATDRLLGRVENGIFSGDPAETGPDILVGGAGNDDLIGDEGDMLMGGAGTDSFTVAYTAGDAAGTITDLDIASETLLLLVDNPDTAVITFVSNGSGGAVLTVDGQPAVVLAGRSVADLTAFGAPWLFVDQA